MTDQEALYGAYLRGFSGTDCAPEDINHVAAYALGKRDANTTVTPPFDDKSPVHVGPELRTCGQVLAMVRLMLPSSSTVPPDVDGMMAAGAALERQVGALTSQLQVATAKLFARDKTIAALQAAAASSPSNDAEPPHAAA